MNEEGNELRPQGEGHVGGLGSWTLTQKGKFTKSGPAPNSGRESSLYRHLRAVTQQGCSLRKGAPSPCICPSGSHPPVCTSSGSSGRSSEPLPVLTLLPDPWTLKPWRASDLALHEVIAVMADGVRSVQPGVRSMFIPEASIQGCESESQVPAQPRGSGDRETPGKQLR